MQPNLSKSLDSIRNFGILRWYKICVVLKHFGDFNPQMTELKKNLLCSTTAHSHSKF